MLSLSKKVFIIGILITLGCLNSSYAWGRPSRAKPPKPGKIMERIILENGRTVLRPVSGAKVSLLINDSKLEVVSSDKGEYLIKVDTSSRLRFGTITVSKIGYRQQTSFRVIWPGTKLINWYFILKDNEPPTLKIIVPAAGEKISTTPTIKLSYGDSGSGIKADSVRIWESGNEVTKYITFRNNQEAVLVVSPNTPLTQGSGWIVAFVSDYAGNRAMDNIVVTIIDMGKYYVDLGKQLLFRRDREAAYQYFQKAMEVAPQNLEARLYFGFTRLALLPMRDEVFALLRDMSFKGPKGVPLTKGHLNPFNLSCEPPINIEQFKLADTFPNGQRIQEVIKNSIIPTIEQTVEDWNIVLKNENFVSDIEITNSFSGTEKIRIDYGDVAILKSMLLGFESKMYELLVRNADVGLAQLSALYANGGFTPEYLLETYPDLLRVKNEEIPISLKARDLLVSAIDSYKSGSDFILADRGYLSTNLYLLNIAPDPQYREQAKLFGEQLQDIKKSLLSSPDNAFSMKFSQLVNLGGFYTNPPDLKRLLDNDSATYFLNSWLPNLDYTRQNFAKATSAYQEFLPPDNGFFKGKKKKADFTDAAGAQSIVGSMRILLLSASAYDFNIDTQTILLEMMKGKKPNIQAILDKYPHLLYLNDRYLIDEAGKTLTDIENSYAQGLNYFLNQEEGTDQSDHLLAATPYFKENASRYGAMLAGLSAMQEVLIDPRTEVKSDAFRLNLGNFFLHYKDIRPFSPQFDKNNRIVPNTLLDETFAGILPDQKF